MQSPILLNEVELDFSKNLYARHPEASIVLDATIGTLATWVVEFYQAEPALAKPLAEQPNLPDDSVSSVTFCLLFGEAVERLCSARLLLLTGHQSRALASCRDSLEALQFAHITREVPAQARRWLAGKHITTPKGLPVPPYVSNELRDSAALLFNKYGTHAYREAVFLSLLPGIEGQSEAVQGNGSGRLPTPCTCKARMPFGVISSSKSARS